MAPGLVSSRQQARVPECGKPRTARVWLLKIEHLKNVLLCFEQRQQQNTTIVRITKGLYASDMTNDDESLLDSQGVGC